ncbi:MAG: NAD(+)/NADH kinase [Dehalococcoidia bacterium]|nr:NAD(+)/NADH kinase [Dehalococcoidia bacterium]
MAADKQAIGLVFNERVPEAVALAKRLEPPLRRDYRVWRCSAAELSSGNVPVADTKAVVTLGGDGTILRAVQVAAPCGVPILGVNMGRVGFMTELQPEEALEKVPLYLNGKAWVEERMMVQAAILPRSSGPARKKPMTYHGLNDAAIGRSAVSRMVFVSVSVDGAFMATYAADAVIIATPTGSTGYALSAGGPVLHPQARTFLIKPVAPQVAANAAVVLHEGAVVTLTLGAGDEAGLSVDGFVNVPLGKGDTLEIKASPHAARFLRMGSPTYFYETLFRRLGYEKSAPPYHHG